MFFIGLNHTNMSQFEHTVVTVPQPVKNTSPKQVGTPSMHPILG